MFDGGHTLFGAWHAVSAANPDDTFLQEVGHCFVALWKDCVTPKGLPIVTWDPATFDAVSGTFQMALGVSGTWMKDIVFFHRDRDHRRCHRLDRRDPELEPARP
ncbi:MAG: hypothetical protein WDO24_06470 [Pseudomonadota bacterium]